jgi:hypothetical protein
MPAGPDTRVKITAGYARHVARDAYFWAWPLVNMYNRRLFFVTVKRMTYQGALPQAPLNTFAMLTDYIVPEQRHVACPNQDVVYGAGFTAFDISPVVVQVPDFGDRFWVYQIVDQRTDGFAQIGKMYGTTTQWVFPEKFFDELPAVLASAPPLPGEEARYAQVLAVLDAIKSDPALKPALIEAAKEAEEQLVEPLFEFRNFGIPLPHHWCTIANGAEFGTDYFTRTAVAKSNILVNAPIQAKYFYQDFDQAGRRLNGSSRYAVTFAKDQTPPVHGFWSLTMYSQYHFFVPNEIRRYSVGTKNKDLKVNPDGSVTIYVQADPPSGAYRTNWLPAPNGEDFSLFMRAYWPKPTALDGSWTPPAVTSAL